MAGGALFVSGQITRWNGERRFIGEAGHHARTAIGAVVMPFGVAIEVEARFLLR